MDLSFSIPLLAGVMSVFLLAGFTKGVTGLGLPTVGVGLLSLFMAPAQAAALVILPSLLTDLWQMTGAALPGLLRRLWPMLGAIVLGCWAGRGLLTGDSAWIGQEALGLVLVAYALFGLSPLRLPAVPPRREAWLGPLAGLCTGLLTAATGVFVLPAVPYLQALSLERPALMQALGLSFTTSTLALAAVLADGGALDGTGAMGSALALLPALLGMLLGQWLQQRLRPAVFRRIFFGGLLLLGAHLLLRGLLG
ncbi:sulfite exporter TauE/SafE family protein [Roseomonas gilardii subsp. gilardii]|uniref:sulfite exporter TauE/SafE family protein n=1 Tax=Roseomonas gilardii TaxID=257708 RepID=UPI001FFB87AD|nr:sulfite exporter TauE/SafE family protein [Roseomonas gilardii]UPG71199.1 sulfite exporter TauE/SafE family protein [Roseomonas gilardii subsp. gilardii]